MSCYRLGEESAAYVNSRLTSQILAAPTRFLFAHKPQILLLRFLNLSNMPNFLCTLVSLAFLKIIFLLYHAFNLKNISIF